VPLSLWAAWGIYSRPLRYRSLFPHNEARKQAIGGLMLTLLFFLPFFTFWLNDVFVLSIGGLYGFLFVPLAVGLVRPNQAEQDQIVDRLRLRAHKAWRRILVHLRQTLRLAKLILSASAAMASALPHIYSKSQQIQASVNQAAFCLAASSLSESYPTNLPASLAMIFLLSPSLLLNPVSRLGRAGQTLASLLVSLLALVVSVQLVQADPFPLSYIATCAIHYILTQPYFKAEEHLVTMVSSSKPFLFDCLEFLYVPIILRLTLVVFSLCLALHLPLSSMLPVVPLLLLPCIQVHSTLLTPLFTELRGLQNLRQPTAEELERASHTCPVCLDRMNGRASRATKCGHVFHSHCLRRCLSVSKTCPCCRAPIT